MSNPSDPLILHRKEYPDIMLLSEIYDPGSGDPISESTSQVPAVGTLVLDLTNPANPRLGYVSAVDEVTYASTISPINLMTGGETNQLLSYGNELLYLFIDRTGEGPWRLIVDSKLAVYGDTAVTYTIFQTLEDGSESAISSISAGDASQLIPLSEVGTSGVKTFNVCVTSASIVDGDILTIHLFDASGLVCGKAKVVLKTAYQYDELSYADDPIVEMAVLPDNLSQRDSADNPVLYRGQDPAELVISATLITAGGEYKTIEESGIDSALYVYGRDDIDTSKAGMTYPLLLKHFLPDNFSTPIVPYIGSNRALTTTINVTIYDQAVDTVLKLVPVPYINGGVWVLYWTKSVISRTEIPLAEVTFENGTFNPELPTNQSFTVKHTLVDQYGVDAVYSQDMAIQVSSTNPPILTLGPTSDIKYGDTSGGSPSTYISYHRDGVFWVDSTLYATVTELLAVCYTRAFPPKLSTEAAPPTPTHFRIINPSTGLAMTAINSLADIHSSVALTSGVAADVGDALVIQKTVGIEWIRQINGTYLYLITTPLMVNVETELPA
jgi:hypothetical protein